MLQVPRQGIVGVLVCACLLTAPVTAVALAGQQGRDRPTGEGIGPIPVVDDFRHDGVVGEWRARRLDRILPASGAHPQALIWVGQVLEGIVVAVETRGNDGTPPHAALRIGLGGLEAPEFPPIGWGHQFGFEALQDSTGCTSLEFGSDDDPSACQAWFAAQQDYRAELPRLFQRVWQVTLDETPIAREVHAAAAFARLSGAIRDRLTPLQPRGGPEVRHRPIAGTEGGRGFEILIPWSAFPPVRVPDLEEVRLIVEWEASTQEAPFGPVPVWPRRPLGLPLHHVVTPCAYGLAGILIPGGGDRLSRPASAAAVIYMIPEGTEDLRTLIVLDNEAAGYLYEPTPETVSPAAYRADYGVLDVGRDERLCTPQLALAREGRRASPQDWSDSGDGDWFRLQVDPRHMEVRRLESGDLMVKSGERVLWSYYGSGQCGGCPRVGLDMFHVSTSTGEVTSALRIFELAEPGARDVEVDVADDWRTVTLYKSDIDFDSSAPSLRWRMTRYCLVEVASEPPPTYEVCAEETDVAEPDNRLRRRYAGEPEPLR